MENQCVFGFLKLSSMSNWTHLGAGMRPKLLDLAQIFEFTSPLPQETQGNNPSSYI